MHSWVREHETVDKGGAFMWEYQVFGFHECYIIRCNELIYVATTDSFGSNPSIISIITNANSDIR